MNIFLFLYFVKNKSVVKEDICDDDMKLPFVNGRAVSWLHQVEGSLIGSDSRSHNSLNTQDFITKPLSIIVIHQMA